MKDSSKKMSRRDWFRLRDPREPLLGESTNAVEEKNVLLPIEHPPNHDGMDLSELPPLREAELTREQIELLFSDIENATTDVQLFQRSVNSSRATPTHVTALPAAKHALLNGSVKKLQIRYRWGGSLWIDTLESIPVGFRLVRIAHLGRNP